MLLNPTGDDSKIAISTSPGLTSWPFPSQTASRRSRSGWMHQAGGTLRLWSMTVILRGTCPSLNSHKPTKSTPKECCQCPHTSHKLRGMGGRSDPCPPLVREGPGHSAPGESTATHGGQGVLPPSRPKRWWRVEDFACNFLRVFFFVCLFLNLEKKAISNKKLPWDVLSPRSQAAWWACPFFCGQTGET